MRPNSIHGILPSVTTNLPDSIFPALVYMDDTDHVRITPNFSITRDQYFEPGMTMTIHEKGEWIGVAKDLRSLINIINHWCA